MTNLPKQTANFIPEEQELLIKLDINKMSAPSGGSASSTSSSSYYSINNSTPHSHSPSSSEGLINFESDSPSSSPSVNQSSPLTENISGHGVSGSTSDFSGNRDLLDHVAVMSTDTREKLYNMIHFYAGSPLDEFCINPLIPLALGLGLFLFLVFLEIRKVWKVFFCEKKSSGQ
uniref:Uncharacterized protein n=1 Tax=Chrysopogon zizanioides TaxID=167337 RepID=A0A7T3V3X1_9POAL|nr:hypothetical protein KQ334_mgp007 [Chrysopogon zizanioides]QPZ94388.1 hypothetical protein [Chrysopogon zizanioides]